MNQHLTARRHDLLGHSQPAATLVRLNRTVDRLRPCCENLGVVGPGQGPHAAELKCAGCGAHRGWLPRRALDFLKTTAARFGAPSDPIPPRDSTIGDFKMTDFDNTNRGAILRNDQKEKETERDDGGTLNGGGAKYWVSGWVKMSKGTKYLSLSIKPKEPGKSKASAGEAFNDEIGF
jgi:hypothetical protein